MAQSQAAQNFDSSIGATISTVGNLIGTQMGINASKHALADQYNYNKALMKMQQQWQEYMSNTAHQREKADLLASGINPLYTATGGQGASTGSSGLAQVTQDNRGEITQRGIEQAFNFAQMKNNLELSRAQTTLLDNQAQNEKVKTIGSFLDNARKQIENKMQKFNLSKQEERYLNEQRKIISETQYNYTTATANQINAEANMSNAQTNKIVGSAEAVSKNIENIDKILYPNTKIGHLGEMINYLDPHWAGKQYKRNELIRKYSPYNE